MSVRERIAELRAELEAAAQELAGLRALAAASTEVAEDGAGVVVDVRQMELRGDGWSVALTKSEAVLMRELLSEPGRFMSRHEIGQSMFGTMQPRQTRNVDAHVNRIRRKLPEQIRGRIEGGYGNGYRWMPAAQAEVATCQ